MNNTSRLKNRYNRPAMSSLIRNRTYQNQSQKEFNKTSPLQPMSTTSPGAATTVASTTSEISAIFDDQPDWLIIVLICIIVLLSIIIIILICYHLSRRKRFARSQNQSKCLSDYDLGYVMPNDVRQSPGALGKEKNVCKHCHKMISEGSSPETEQDAHAYIYLQNDDHAPIPEVIYPNIQSDMSPNAKNNMDTIYYTIDTKAENDPQTQSDKKADNHDSGLNNVYQELEPDNVVSKT